MGLVLAATGAFLYVRLGADLDRTMDQGLHSRAADLTALVRQADQGLAQAGASRLAQQGDGFAQILDPRGRVQDATEQVRSRALLSPAQLARARRGTLLVERSLKGPDGEPSRLLATPVRAQGRQLVVVTGTDLGDRDDALRSLAVLLLIGGPIALALAAAGGYGVAAVALRPVESMRRRAAAISAGDIGKRLPVSPAGDELTRLGDTLNEMLARLELALERERRFVSDASHELRTPLAILKAELELALRSGRSADELRAALGSAGEETDRLVRLAEDLLVIARSDRGRLPIQPVELQARDLLEDVRGRFRKRAEQAQRPLAVEVEPGLELWADPLRLEQALGNLVDNALRHGSGAVSLAARRAGGEVELRVTDRGPGFPPDFLASAFERFSRAEPARGRGGAGLGLAIVAAVAAAHGGSAAASNVDGGGAVVSIVLPAAGR